MNNVFKTFKPKNSLIAKYVDYYYLDVKPKNSFFEFECYPHFNTTISLYQSHKKLDDSSVIFDANTSPLQIFTPIRDKVLTVKQKGKVYRIVIVFQPLGIQQFFRKLDFSDFLINFKFFDTRELNLLFTTEDISILTEILDFMLLERYQKYENVILENSIHYIFNNNEDLLIEDLALKLNVSRRHLNRVFNQHFGVSIKKFQNIVFFRKILNQKLFENPKKSFTALAYEFYYSDQSHLIKTFQNFTSKSPKKIVREGTHLGNEDTFWKIE